MKIEGWDIELQFRNIANRLSTLLVALFTAFAFCSPYQLQAESPQDAIDNVMSHEDFNEYIDVESYSRAPDSSKERTIQEGDGDEFISTDDSSSVSTGIGTFFIYLLVFACFGAVIWMFVLLIMNSRKMKLAAPIKNIKQQVNQVMGMDISMQALPDNIPNTVMKLWEAGQSRAALSLLYRGCLAESIDLYKINLDEADTEGECLAKVNKKAKGYLKEYFSSLTLYWQQLAYAHIEPSKDDIALLCKNWAKAFTSGEVK